MNSTALILASAFILQTAPSAQTVEFYGYKDCIRLQNKVTRVTLCPAAGGRPLEYTLNGKNALYLPPGNEGWTMETGKGRGSMDAGRTDIGPEYLVPKRDLLWKGRWQGEITGPLTARLTSQKDPSTGVQLVREFTLDETTSRLVASQTIRNVSDSPKEYCHWSRTFALGGGIVVVPLSEHSRFPNSYVQYESRKLINVLPEDPNIRRNGRFLEIVGAPKFAKLGMDTQEGWMAYLMKNDVMFVKQYKVFPDRPYNEVAGLTMSIWYPDHGRMCELEPIGPAEKLAPGQSATFTEVWTLLPHTFPKDKSSLGKLDSAAIAKKVSVLPAN